MLAFAAELTERKSKKSLLTAARRSSNVALRKRAADVGAILRRFWDAACGTAGGLEGWREVGYDGYKSEMETGRERERGLFP